MKHQLIDQYASDDSLVQYGDGVFETMLAIDANIHHWNYHWQRLQASCQRLQISQPDYALLTKQLHAKLAEQNHKGFVVVKMIVSRGEGLRGYQSLVTQRCYVTISVSPYIMNAEKYHRGLSVRVCRTRLSHQPLLAGMKHCNRLEYLMARREPSNSLFDEGLLLDYDNNVIEGLVSNVFILKKRTDKEVYTPKLDKAGVKGTVRDYLSKHLGDFGYMWRECELSLDDLISADCVFLTNAITGLLPVSSLSVGDKTMIFKYDSANRIRTLMAHPCSVF